MSTSGMHRRPFEGRHLVIFYLIQLIFLLFNILSFFYLNQLLFHYFQFDTFSVVDYVFCPSGDSFWPLPEMPCKGCSLGADVACSNVFRVDCIPP